MIENVYPHMAFSSAKSHKELIEAGRDELVELSKERGKPISHKQAEN